MDMKINSYKLAFLLFMFLFTVELVSVLAPPYLEHWFSHNFHFIKKFEPTLIKIIDSLDTLVEGECPSVF